MTDQNDFKNLEHSLRKALGSEKQVGLKPGQLNDLHQAIDAGSRRNSAIKKPSRWQWSLAGSILATAVIAFIVVDRFPGSENQNSETPATWQEPKESTAQPPAKPEQEAPAGLRKSDRPAESVTLERSRNDLAPKKMAQKDSAADKKKTIEHAGPKVESKLRHLDGAVLGKNQSKFKALKKPGGAPAPSATAAISEKKQWNTPGTQPSMQSESETAADKSDASLAAAKPTTAAPNTGSARGFGKGASKNSKTADEASNLSEQGLAGSGGFASGSSGGTGIGQNPQGKSLSGGTFLSNQQRKTSIFNVLVEEFETSGSLSGSNAANAVVRGNLFKLRRCYEAFERKSPDPAGPRDGKLRITWTINTKGRVTAIQNPSGSANLTGIRDCVLRKIQLWKFPADAALEVSMTVHFKKI